MTTASDWTTPDGSARVLLGDCRDLMRGLPDCSVDAVVCDPPYGLEFMGKAWDSLGGRTKPYKARTENGHGNTGILPMYGRGGTPDDRDAFKRNANVQSQAWHHTWAVEALRVLKPGGFLLAFGGTRTYHRLACALEDAGFEIRDMLTWMHGQGFPKGLDVSKQIDKQAGAEREVTAVVPSGGGDNYDAWRQGEGRDDRTERHQSGLRVLTAPATDAARQWDGWNVALKPAFEPVVLARKPLSEPNVAANVLRWGTGALNIDGCRIAHKTVDDGSLATNPHLRSHINAGNGGHVIATESNRRVVIPHTDGRWPANVILGHHPECQCTGTRKTNGNGHWPASRPASTTECGPAGHSGQDGLDERHADGESIETWDCHPDCPVRLLDEQTGPQKSGGTPRRRFADKTKNAYGMFNGQENPEGIGRTAGNVSRFFYQAKAGRRDRYFFCRDCGTAHCETDRAAHAHGHVNAAGKTDWSHIVAHPTVKPLAMMRYLVRLVTPPGGTVLDPFGGTGTTLVACCDEGVRSIGMEQDPEYAVIIQTRLNDQAKADRKREPRSGARKPRKMNGKPHNGAVRPLRQLTLLEAPAT
jgi:DNA modification methylase